MQVPSDPLLVLERIYPGPPLAVLLVADDDTGVRGEGLDQGQLARREEGTASVSSHAERPERPTIDEKRHEDPRAHMPFPYLRLGHPMVLRKVPQDGGLSAAQNVSRDASVTRKPLPGDAV